MEPTASTIESVAFIDFPRDFYILQDECFNISKSADSCFCRKQFNDNCSELFYESIIFFFVIMCYGSKLLSRGKSRSRNVSDWVQDVIRLGRRCNDGRSFETRPPPRSPSSSRSSPSLSSSSSSSASRPLRVVITHRGSGVGRSGGARGLGRDCGRGCHAPPSLSPPRGTTPTVRGARRRDAVSAADLQARARSFERRKGDVTRFGRFLVLFTVAPDFLSRWPWDDQTKEVREPEVTSLASNHKLFRM